MSYIFPSTFNLPYISHREAQKFIIYSFPELNLWKRRRWRFQRRSTSQQSAILIISKVILLLENFRNREILFLNYEQYHSTNTNRTNILLYCPRIAWLRAFRIIFLLSYPTTTYFTIFIYIIYSELNLTPTDTGILPDRSETYYWSYWSLIKLLLIYRI